jgi:hypothetical protein
MKYEVELAMTEINNYWCHKSQLTGILCDNLLVVYSFKKLDYTKYVSPYYSIQYFINTWSGHWRSYDNKRDWSMYNDPIIMPDPTKINKWRRRNIHLLMVVDKMKGCINGLPTRVQARSSKIWFILDDIVFMFYYYNCQNNLILVVVVIFYFFDTILVTVVFMFHIIKLGSYFIFNTNKKQT